MAVLIRQCHRNRKFIIQDAEAAAWVDAFFDRGASRRGYPTIRVRDAVSDSKNDWSLLIGTDTVSIPRVGVGAAIRALVFSVDREGRDIATYEGSDAPRSVWASSAGLPTLGKR